MDLPSCRALEVSEILFFFNFNSIAMPLNNAPKANPANTIIEKVKCNPNSVVLSSLNNPTPNNPTAPERSESKPKNACKSI